MEEFLSVFRPSLWQCSDSKPVSLEIVVHTNDPCLRCLFCIERMLQNLSLSLLQLLPICYVCKISIALFLHVGLPWANNLHMLSCHTMLYCFSSAEMLSSDRAWGDQGILGFLSATKHARGLQTPGQSGLQPVAFTQYITVVVHQDELSRQLGRWINLKFDPKGEGEYWADNG